MSRKHMNRDFPQGIDANILGELFLQFVQDVVIVYGMPDRVYWDNAETVLGTSIRNVCRIRFPAIRVMPAAKKRIKDRIDFTVRLLGAGLFSMTDECQTLRDAMQDAVWNPKTAEDERLDDGSTDIDSLDAYEYTIEREIREITHVKTYDI